MRWWLWAVAAVLLTAGGSAWAEDKPAAKKRLLVITESRGFRHSCVARKGDELSLVEKTLIELGKQSGSWEAECTQDSRTAITAENLKNFDAVFFYTTGELPLSEVQKADLLQFIRSGKGFAGSHSATDTFYKWREYGELIGGYFDLHPFHTKVPVVVEDTNHPATKHLGKTFSITDEIYQFKVPYSRAQLHILMRIDPQWIADRRTEEQKAIEQDRKTLPDRIAKLKAEGKLKEAKALEARAGRQPAIHRTDDDFALAWTRDYGKGRVFYT